jgi:hypothetical protein
MEQAALLDEADLIDIGRTRYAPIIEKKMAAYEDLLAAAAPQSEAKAEETEKTE